MARIDKAWFVVRAIAGTALTGLVGVKLNAGGSVIPAGTAANDAIGVVCIPGTIAAGYPCSILREGEIVEFSGAAATTYYSTGAAGSIGTATTGTKIGFTVEASRLVVHL